MCKEHKQTEGPLSWIFATLIVMVVMIVCIGKLGFFEAKAQTPTPINKRFSQTSVNVYGNKTHVVIDNVTGIACYRPAISDHIPWSCAQSKAD